MTVGTLTTADELLRLPRDGWRYELLRGELKKMSPSGARHAQVSARIIVSLGQYVDKHALGVVYASEGGFRISRNPDTVLAPDASFVRADRVVDTVRFFEGPPDAAFEVVSPNDSYTEVNEKTAEWLSAGTRVVVIVDPRTRRITAHRASGAVQLNDGIEIEDVVPGWRMSLKEVFG
ncbi:MAG TPA: Uma2 family endonuclease [Thermoanaerobaculia bacterium]|nr:Uma2 family endonuclease [Thermoanaerobaculia bacterium]